MLKSTSDPQALNQRPSPQLGSCGADRSAGALRVVTKVRQRMNTDCGVACLAMVAGVTYEVAAEAFTAAGLHLQRKNKKPFMSNFRELAAAADHLRVQLHQRPFRAWSDVCGATIVRVAPASSVPGLSTRDWHWVVAHRTATGIHIEDPASEYPCFEVPPPLANTVDFDWCRPTGAVLSAANVSRVSCGLTESRALPLHGHCVVESSSRC